MRKESPFKGFQRNITSQFGEDGIVGEIFSRITTNDKICVEFGAWDGIHCSNTWNLWHNNNWEAILIEADEKKFIELTGNTKNFQNVKIVNKYVSSEGENRLDNILNKFRIPKDFDFLSIDIDGDDYFILESLKEFNPKLIVIEYNPTIPPQLSIIQKKGEYFGSSALAIHELATKKGYKLIQVSDTNLFLIYEDYFPILKVDEQNLLEIFPMDYINYIFSSYDGDLFASNNFTYGIKKYTKNLFSFFNYRIQKEINLKEFPFEPDDKVHKIVINRQLKNNASNI